MCLLHQIQNCNNKRIWGKWVGGVRLVQLNFVCVFLVWNISRVGFVYTLFHKIRYPTCCQTTILVLQVHRLFLIIPDLPTSIRDLCLFSRRSLTNIMAHWRPFWLALRRNSRRTEWNYQTKSSWWSLPKNLKMEPGRLGKLGKQIVNPLLALIIFALFLSFFLFLSHVQFCNCFISTGSTYLSPLTLRCETYNRQGYWQETGLSSELQMGKSNFAIQVYGWLA